MSVSSFVESVCSGVKHAGLLAALAGSVAAATGGSAKGDVDFSFSLSFGNVFSWCEPVYVCPPAVVVTPVYCPPPVVVHRPWLYCPPTYYYRAPVYSHWRGWDDCDDRWVYRPYTSVTTTTYFGHYSSYTTTYSSYGYGHGYHRPTYYGYGHGGYGSGLSLNFFFGDDDDCDRDWRHDRYRRDRHDRYDYRDRDRDRDRDYGRGRDNQPIYQSSNNVTVNNYGPVGPQTIQQVGPVGPNAGGVFPASNAGHSAGSGIVTGLDGREGPRSQAKPMRFASEQDARNADIARDQAGRGSRDREIERARSQQASKPVFAPEPVRMVDATSQQQPAVFGPTGPAVKQPVVRKPVESAGRQPPARPKPLRVEGPAFAEAPQPQPVAIAPSQPVVKPANTRPAADTWTGPRGPEKPVVSNPVVKPTRSRESGGMRESGRQPATKPASRPAFEAGEIRVEQPRTPRVVEKAPAFTSQPSRAADAGPRPSSKPMRTQQAAPVFEQPRVVPSAGPSAGPSMGPSAGPRPSLKPGERPARLSDLQKPSSKPRERREEKK